MIVRQGDERTDGLTRAFRGIGAPGGWGQGGQGAAPLLTCGRFVGLVELGRGASSVVYEAYEPVAERRVAIKVFAWGIPTEMADREACVLARLEGARCPTLLERGRTRDGRDYLAMTLVPGAISVADWIEARQAGAGLGARVDAWGFVRGAASALASLHERGVVHRDIKPSNLLIDARGGVWVIDLGLAKGVGDASGGTSHGDRLGTVGYTSPEQRSSPSDVTPSADIYALGRVLSLIRPERDAPRWSRLIDRMIEDDPARRPADAPGLCSILEALHRRRARRGRYLLGFVAALATAMAVRVIEGGVAPASRDGDRMLIAIEHALDNAEQDGRLMPGEVGRALTGTLASDPKLGLGLGGIALAMYLERVEAYEEALEVALGVAGEDDPVVSPRARALAGRLRHRLGDLTGARSELEQAVGELGPGWPRASLWLSAVLIDQGDLAGASALIDLAGQDAADARDREDVELSRAYLAEVSGHARGAIGAYERALALRRQRVHPESLGIASLTSRLGTMLAEAGDTARAEALLDESLRIRAAHEQTRPTQAAHAHASLAHALIGWGRADEAVVQFGMAIELYERSLGPEHVFVGKVRSGLARSLVEAGRYDEAEAEARRALSVLAAARGAGHWEYANAQRHLAAALHGLGRSGEACSLLAEAISTLRTADAPRRVREGTLADAAEIGCDVTR